VMVIVLIADVSILLFSRKRLICYRCRSRYHNLAIARYHRRWDRSVAERYPAPAKSPDDDGDSASELEPPAEGAAVKPATGATRLTRSLANVSALPGR